MSDLTGKTSGRNGTYDLVANGTGQTVFADSKPGSKVKDTFTDSAGKTPDWIWALGLDDIKNLKRTGDVFTTEQK